MKAPLLLSAVLGALLTLALLDGRLGLVLAYQGAAQPAAITQPAATITIELDRTRKGDRLSPSEGATTTTIGKTPVKPAAADPRLAPAKLGGCEPLASPIVDAALAQLAGRCVV